MKRTTPRKRSTKNQRKPISTKEAPMMYAQGDLLFRLVPAAQATGQPVAIDQGRLIFAYGEVTGHHHSVPAHVGSLTLDPSTGIQYLTLDDLIGDTQVEHQEHDPIPLTRVDGMVWEIRRQYEWTDANEPIRVAD